MKCYIMESGSLPDPYPPSSSTVALGCLWRCSVYIEHVCLCASFSTNPFAFTVKVGNTILDLEVLCKIAAMNDHLFCFRHFDCIETFSSFT